MAGGKAFWNTDGGTSASSLNELTDVDLAASAITDPAYALVEDPNNPGTWIRGALGTVGDDLASWDANVTIVDDSMHNGFPGFCIADDGTYLAAYARSTSHNATTADVYLSRSTDRGTTWSAGEEIIAGGGNAHDNPSLSKLSDGRIALTYSRETGGAKVTAGAWVVFSSDHGDTFGTPIGISHGFDQQAIGGSQVVGLPNGDLLTAIWGKDAADTYWSVTVSKSTDDGASWSHIGTIANGQTDSRQYNETGLALVGSTVVSVVRSETGPNHYVSTSSDSGVTWSAPSLIATSGTGNPRLAYDGHRLVFAYRNTPATGDPLAMALSIDGGTTWSLITTGTPSPATTNEMSYAQLAVEADGRFAMVHGYEGAVDGSDSDVYFTRESTSPVSGYVTDAEMSAGLATKSDTSHTHGGGGGVAVTMLHVREEQASGTNGGSAAVGWQTRVLNTVKTNEITGASLSANVVTLPAGTYEVDARAPMALVNNCKARLYNVTAGATLIVGASDYARGTSVVQSDSTIKGRFTLAVESGVRLDAYATQVADTNGLGIATSAGVVEVYSEMFIRKIA